MPITYNVMMMHIAIIYTYVKTVLNVDGLHFHTTVGTIYVHSSACEQCAPSESCAPCELFHCVPCEPSDINCILCSDTDIAS